MARRVGVYARMSLDIEGLGLGVARQVEDCTHKATLLGWQVVEVYSDNDVSASKSRARPEYERLLKDLESGRISAVVVYDLDRLTRKPVELEAFIDLTDRLGVALANVSGDVDLTTAAGRMVARIKGAVARQEAERIGERVKRQKQQRLAAGRPPAGRYRTFGYTRDWCVVPDEAVIVREVFERVANGESVRSVTRDLEARSVRRVNGGLWQFSATLRMIDSPIYAGFLTYKGERAGKADIEPLVSETVFDGATKARVRKPGAWTMNRTSLLSGIALCDVCKTPMVSNGDHGYTCNRNAAGACGNVKIQRVGLDAAINDNIWQVLAHDYKNRDKTPKTDLKAQLTVLDERIEKTQQALTSGALAYEDGIPMLGVLRGKREALIASQEATETFHQHLVDYINADVSRQAAEVRRHVSAILVKPTPKRGNTKFDASRFDVVLKSGEVIPGPEFVAEGFSRVVRVFAKSRGVLHIL